MMTENERFKLVRAARQSIKQRGKASDFAKKHGLARTTVIGWSKDHHRPRGRPCRLETFNITEVLKKASGSGEPQNWKSLIDLARHQSGETLGRRMILRLMKKWELSPAPAEANNHGCHFLEVAGWIQPAWTLASDESPQRYTIWRLLSRRGMECFMLTTDDSDEAAAGVASAMAGRMKSRSRKVRTNHPGLARALPIHLEKWSVLEL